MSNNHGINNLSTKCNADYTEKLISELKQYENRYSATCFTSLFEYNNSFLDEENFDDDNSLLTKLYSIRDYVSIIKKHTRNLRVEIENSYADYVSRETSLSNSANELADSSSVGVSSSTASTNTSSSDDSTSSSSSKSSEVSIGNEKKKVNELNIEDLLVDMLAPFGVSKDNFEGVTKTDKGYTITLKNPNEDGKWKSNDIKEYYITDGKVSGVLTGDGTYVKVEDGELVIDKDSSKIYASVFTSAVGTAGSYFATKANYNTESNKEIFKKFYPNATDEEFDSFCENISENGEKYSEIAEKAIDTYSDNIAEIAEKNGYNYLVVEDNKIQVDYTGVATELYAYESSKSGISFAEGINSEITFNDAVATDLAEYLKTNYSIDVDVNSIVNGNAGDVASAVNDSNIGIEAVSNSSNVVGNTTSFINGVSSSVASSGTSGIASTTDATVSTQNIDTGSSSVTEGSVN